MKVVILAGGKGSRLSEETSTKPKPMVEIGGRPMLWHIMKYYSSFGFNDFIVALGYKGEVIKHYFLNYLNFQNDLIVDFKKEEIKRMNPAQENWTVQLVDTGDDTGTGGRLKKLQSLIKENIFLMTYGDGVSNVNLKTLVDFHLQHGKIATVCAVHPPSRFGSIEFKKDHLVDFSEKPQVNGAWINGGFFVLSSKVFSYLHDDMMMFEREPLENLSKANQLIGYKHDSFWQCMDTLRDVQYLEHLWQNNEAQWKIW